MCKYTNQMEQRKNLTIRHTILTLKLGFDFHPVYQCFLTEIEDWIMRQKEGEALRFNYLNLNSGVMLQH